MLIIMSFVISLFILLITIVKTTKEHRKTISEVLTSLFMFIFSVGALLFNCKVLYDLITEQEAINRVDVFYITLITIMVLSLFIAIMKFASQKLRRLSKAW